MQAKLLPLQILVLAAVVVFTLFLWQGNRGFSLADEGFLWYGTQRVMLGEVPIRDFMAYDPGRYYWSAALMSLWGDNGIMALRGAVAAFQATGLFVGLLLVARAGKKQRFVYLILSAVTLVMWMFPRHKLFDISLSILLIGALAYLVQSPTPKRHFLAGVLVGLAAVFGRNHGMYGAAGSLGIMLWLSIKRAEGPRLMEAVALWAAGVVVGFMPVLLMALLVPGFATAFGESIRLLLEFGATNLALPVPWPWRVDVASMPLGEAIRAILVGLFFVATLAFGTLSIVWVFRQRLQNRPVSPALVAASFLALPYAHYAYSRADVNHLAQGIFPLLVGCLVLAGAQPARLNLPIAVALCTASLWVTYVFQPGWQCRTGAQCVNIEVSGRTLVVDRGTATEVGGLRELAARYAPNGQSFFVAPFWPGAYALLERRSPTWEIYALLPRSPAFQRGEIERLKTARPSLALLSDLPTDGRNELRFSSTHALIFQYIQEHFERTPESTFPGYETYKAVENP